MTDIVIFGNKNFAKLMNYHFSDDTSYRVVAFTISNSDLKNCFFEGKPLISFDECLKKFPPKKYKMFLAIGYSQVNNLRAKIYDEIIANGYTCVNYISSKAVIQNAYAMGNNCAFFAGSIIEPFVKIGNNNTFWSNTVLAHDCIIGDHNHFSPSVAISGFTTIGNKNFFGIQSTIRDGLTIGNNNIFGMGTVITKNITNNEVYVEQASIKLKHTSDYFFDKTL